MEQTGRCYNQWLSNSDRENFGIVETDARQGTEINPELKWIHQEVLYKSVPKINYIVYVVTKTVSSELQVGCCNFGGSLD